MRIFRQSGQFDLAYMLRELALIVIGVTLALSATSWYEQWSDRQTEQAYLDRIRSSLERDISRFDGFDESLQRKAAFLKALLTDGVDQLMSRDTAELMHDLHFSSYRTLPRTDSAVFSELRNTGRLALLRDDEWRDSLARYYGEYELMWGIFQQSSGPYRTMIQSAMPGIAMYDWRIDQTPVSADDFRLGLERLMSMPGVEAAINADLYYTADMRSYMGQYRDWADFLLTQMVEGSENE